MKTQSSKMASPQVVAPLAGVAKSLGVVSQHEAGVQRPVSSGLQRQPKKSSGDCDYLSVSKERAEELANLEREYFREMAEKGKVGYIGAGTPILPPLPLDKINSKIMAEIMSKIKKPKIKPPKSQ